MVEHLPEALGFIPSTKKRKRKKKNLSTLLALKTSSSLPSQVCGVCGNFNGEEEDELMTSHDELAQDEQEFMDSWKDKDIDPK